MLSSMFIMKSASSPVFGSIGGVGALVSIDLRFFDT
jgi:hypothetical protein